MLSELPKFNKVPASETTGLVGQDVFLECSASGEPNPSIEWSREGGKDIDVAKIKIVTGKGKKECS